MIRRDFKKADGAVSWLLISQVEHARISGLLARHWVSGHSSWREGATQPLPYMVSGEILTAIAHHDDGWSRWEAKPQIDPVHGRPYSFMNELPLGVSLAIWDGSIDAARQIGPLAGWMVASHFYELLKSGNHTHDDRAIRWLKTIDIRRLAWLQEWQSANASHTTRLAEQTVRLLQACDFLSLWLCCDCPVAANEVVENVAPFVLHWPHATYEFSARRRTNGPPAADDPFAEPGWQVIARSWPFDKTELYLTAEAGLVPVRRYAASQELLAVRRPLTLHWRLEGS